MDARVFRDGVIDGKGSFMERKRKGRLPGAAAVLAAALLLTTGAPGSTAGGSPLAGAAEPVPYKSDPAVLESGAAAGAERKAPPRKTPEKAPEKAEEPEKIPCPVPETEAVEDTYFDSAVFLGDSRTEGLFLYSGLKTGHPYTAVGATVESVFTKQDLQTESGKKVPILDAMADQACDKVYIMLGINELGWTKTETYHDQYAKLIDRVRQDHPQAKIALQSIPPVSAKQEAKKTYVNNKRIRAYNEVIQALAEEKECYFLDVAPCLTSGGVLPADRTTDGIHFNAAGCKIWLDYLRTHSLEAEAIAAAQEKA